MDFAGKMKREKNKRKEKCGHIFADYLQLLQIDKENEKKQKNRVSEINFLFVLGCMYGYWWMYRLPFINSNRKILVKTAFFFRFCSPSTHTLNRDQTKLYIHYTGVDPFEWFYFYCLNWSLIRWAKTWIAMKSAWI